MQVLFAEKEGFNETNPRIAEIDFLPRKGDRVYWEDPRFRIDNVNPYRIVAKVEHYPFHLIEVGEQEFPRGVKVKIIVEPVAEVKLDTDYSIPDISL